MKLKELSLKYRGKYLNHYEGTYENENGHSKVYEIISRDKDLTERTFGKACRKNSDGVGIIVFNEYENKILLEKEFRMACNEWVYNFPGGLVDKGETLEQAAERELREETGLTLIKVLDTIPCAYTAVGVSNELVATVICKAEGDIKPSDSEDEEIESRWYTRSEVRKLIESGEPMSLRTQTFLYMWSHGRQIMY